jgi:tetratricopeptide (TPR) repeat protein
MNILAGRRPELIFLFALALFATVSALNWAQSQQQPTPTGAGIVIEGLGLRGQVRDAQETAVQLQEYVRQNPGDAAAQAQLGTVYLQLARDTGDPSYYTRAEGVFGESLRLDPQNVDALLGLGTLALARHQFTAALDWGEQARALNPYRAQTLGIIGDAQIELGRYDEAIATIQQMVDLRPDLSSYSRVSYLRELHGDVDGAIEMMQRAVAAGGPAAENTAWTTVQLGNLFFNRGDLEAAEREYARAMTMLPGYVHGQAGLGRVQAARGQDEAAIASYRAAVERMPLPEFVIALGEVYAKLGREAEAADQWALVRAMQQLNASNGMDVELELALFEIEHGAEPEQTIAQARQAYQRRPGIYAADVLAWALFHGGQLDEAARYSQEALRLGTRDALMHYHAGRIAEARGETAQARAHYAAALEINPHFSIKDADDARARVARLGG